MGGRGRGRGRGRKSNKRKREGPSPSFYNQLREDCLEDQTSIFRNGESDHVGVRHKEEVILHQQAKKVRHNTLGEYYATSVRTLESDNEEDADHFFRNENAQQPQKQNGVQDDPSWIPIRNRQFSRWDCSANPKTRDKLKKDESEMEPKHLTELYACIYANAKPKRIQEWERLDKARGLLPGWDPRIGDNHFTMTVPAMRMSGKSTFIEKFLSKHIVSRDTRGRPHPVQFFHHMVLIKPTALKDSSIDKKHFDEIICGDEGEKQGGSAGEYINDVIRKIMLREYDYRTLVVLDDILGEIGHGGNHLINRFTARNRHHSTSIIIGTQTFKSVSPIVRVNTSHWIIFRILNSDERDKMFKEIEAVKQFYGRVVWEKESFSFLFITTIPGPRIMVYKNFEKYLGDVTG